MTHRRYGAKTAAVLACAAMLAGALTACGGLGGSGGSGGSPSGPGATGKLSGPVTIKLMAGGNDPASTATANAYASGFHQANPMVTVTVDTRPGGTDGDNLIKTQLATGSMDDVFLYNSGSLFRALHPDTTLQPLTNEPWVENLSKDFKTTVSTARGTYGAPVGTTYAGGVMYNKKVYAKLGLSVPTSWSQFIGNSQKIKAAGIILVLQTYGDTWTSQLFVLGSFANISAVDAQWATKYTANDPSAKYSEQPAQPWPGSTTPPRSTSSG